MVSQSINRYDLKKAFIATGLLTMNEGRPIMTLTYKDSEIEESATEQYHPLIALEKLRRILEEKHGSLLGCVGCRIDTAYRPTGGYKASIINVNERTIELTTLFEPTDEVEKLCTVDEHRAAFKKFWEENMKPPPWTPKNLFVKRKIAPWTTKRSDNNL